MRTAIFDLDGTLADTSADLIAAANACFRARGMGDVLDPVADARIAFRGGRAMLRAGHARSGAGAEVEVAEDYPRLLAHYAENIDRETRLYPGAEAAVRELSARGWKVAVCTNKPVELAETLLERLGVLSLFGALVGAGTLAVTKPDPAPYVESVRRAGGRVARSFLIGDTETDRETARAVGVPACLVTFGPDGRGVADLDPDLLLDHYDALPEVAERLFAPD